MFTLHSQESRCNEVELERMTLKSMQTIANVTRTPDILFSLLLASSQKSNQAKRTSDQIKRKSKFQFALQFLPFAFLFYSVNFISLNAANPSVYFSFSIFTFSFLLPFHIQ